jgi:hypothetical protein
MVVAMKPTRIFFWELAQNFPPLVALLMAAWLWQQEQPVQALTWVLVGGLSGALLFRLTQFKVTARSQPESTTVMHIAVMTSAMFFCVIYLMSNKTWSNWRLDLLIGILVGFLWLSGYWLQGRLDFSLENWLTYSLPLSITVPLLFSAVRWLAGNSLLLTLIGAILVTVGFTLLVHFYSRFFLRKASHHSVEVG